MNTIIRQLFLQIYGSDYEQFNTVADTADCVPFWFLQVFRMLSLIALTLTTVCYVYIYFRSAIVQLNFWALILTTVAVAFLFR